MKPSLKDKGSFVDDLNTEQGIVRSRVALLLRSSEIQPMFKRSPIPSFNDDNEEEDEEEEFYSLVLFLIHCLIDSIL